MRLKVRFFFGKNVNASTLILLQKNFVLFRSEFRSNPLKNTFGLCILSGPFLQSHVRSGGHVSCSNIRMYMQLYLLLDVNFMSGIGMFLLKNGVGAV